MASPSSITWSDGSSPFLENIKTSELHLVPKMAREIWAVAYRDIISSEQMEYMLGKMYATDRISKEIESGDSLFYWIVLEDKRAGFTAFGPLAKSHPCEIHKLYVLPGHQGTGAGRAAIAAICTMAGRAGASYLELRVNRYNSKAISFYEFCGFRKHSSDCKDIGNGFVMDDFILRKPLENGRDFSS